MKEEHTPDEILGVAAALQGTDLFVIEERLGEAYQLEQIFELIDAVNGATAQLQRQVAAKPALMSMAAALISSRCWNLCKKDVHDAALFEIGYHGHVVLPFPETHFVDADKLQALQIAPGQTSLYDCLGAIPAKAQELAGGAHVAGRCSPAPPSPRTSE